MTATAILSGHRVEVRISVLADTGLTLAGTVLRIHNPSEAVDGITVGDHVTIPIKKICHLDQDAA